MTSEQEKRAYVRRQYDSKSWQDKVDKMPDRQIQAIFFRLNATRRRDHI